MLACPPRMQHLRHDAQRRRQCRAVLLGALQLTDHRRPRSLACRHSRRRLRRRYGLHATRYSESRLAVWRMARNRDTQGVPSRQHFAANVYAGHQDGGIASQGGFPAGWPHTGDLASWVPLLLQGKPGSSTNHAVPTEATRRHRPPFALRTRLEDFDRLASVIVEEAEHNVRDPQLVGEVNSLVRSYVAGNFIGHMAIERSRARVDERSRRQPGHGDDGCRARTSRIFSGRCPGRWRCSSCLCPQYGSSGEPSDC